MTHETNDRLRATSFYSLVSAVSEHKFRVTTPSETDELARLMTDMLDHDPYPVLRWRAADFLAEHPNPLATEALLRAAHDQSATLARGCALDALVSLHERRVLPELLRDIADPKMARDPSTLRRLADLGDSAVLVPLQEFASDSTHRDDQRENARRAERDLRLFLESGFMNGFPLSDRELHVIRENGFVIVPADKNEMYELYGATYPFVTTDVILHTFMILLRASLGELDRLVLMPDVTDLSGRLLADCLAQARELSNPHLKTLAQRNAGVFAVPVTLLTGKLPGTPRLPTGVAQAVGSEVDKIKKHEGEVPSALFGYTEDFTKYAPRGRDDLTPDLAPYYPAMLYYGRMMFRAQSLEQTQQALLLLDVLSKDSLARREWARTDSLLSELFGTRDDLTILDYERIVRVVQHSRTGDRRAPTYAELARDRPFVRTFSESLLQTNAPRIRTATPTSPTGKRSATAEVGLRVFGQRYTRPIHMLQILMDEGVWPPSGLQVASALLGSPGARQILAEKGAGMPAFPGIDRPPGSEPYGSLSEGWIHASQALFDSPVGAPDFMRRAAWEEKEINTALGAWAELQNSTVLYTKDANVYKSASRELDRFHGYVEPVPEFYRRLKQLIERYTRSLDNCGLFLRVGKDRDSVLAALGPTVPMRDAAHQGPEGYRKILERREAAIRVERSLFEELASVLDQLEAIASKEVTGEAQSIDDGYFLKGLYRRLMYLSFNRSGANIAQTSMAIVSDVASEYRSQTCLEVGVGRPAAIYAAIPDSANTFVCKGAVYLYYEFLRPIQNRLNDSEWRDLSRDQSQPTDRPWIFTRPEVGLTTEH